MRHIVITVSTIPEYQRLAAVLDSAERRIERFNAEVVPSSVPDDDKKDEALRIGSEIDSVLNELSIDASLSPDRRLLPEAQRLRDRAESMIDGFRSDNRRFIEW